MKKILNFRMILTIVWIICAVLIFVKSSGAVMITGLVMSTVIYIAIMSTLVGIKYENESRRNPSTISFDEVGKIFRVAEIDNKIIGLVTWGYKEYALQDLEEFKTFYYAQCLPVEFRKVDFIFQVGRINDKLVFNEVKVNGFSDKSKKPFETLPENYFP